ncbi:tudor domain-containing 6-like isoform X1 [Haliotis rufescens]|uniref:tudor domain-containing 6-like isoform X1 n=1 Tax=Haliotis rufescens TaxID=6454 RepID=UPI00201E96D0|nr:tudor domain-containing 6-like isoform X1 [Haliotis rufescens]XP_046357076.2 tudor domain-containing 6-like isoform X1 [Haliotis rufescens]XP_046357077.2 tudor domain-containing 6-like isoform X1 [Haliotis rufescens]XP_046357079.2 tudor domain-containing 6-like isoform X1 [Haliotis rufescens]XP_046357080.2 tudor domain-containing 6-like isoform X1 [Haliotis rufescens]
MAEGELKQVKAMLRSVLLSCKEGVASQRFLVDYRDVTGEYLPYKKFGFNSVSEFIASIPDVVHVRRQGGEEMYHAVADETTAHIQKLVSKQRSKKTKRPLRRAPVRNPFLPSKRPMGRGYTPPYRPQGGGFQRPPPHQPHFAAVRRFDPRPHVATPQVHRAPLLPLPRSSPEEWSSSPPSSPMNSSEPFHNFQITLRNSAGNRMVGAGEGPRPRVGRMIMRAVSEAVSDCQGERRPNNIKFGHKFEVPPRFRRNQDSFAEPLQGLQAPLPLAAQQVRFYGDGTDYIEKINKYIWKRNLLPIKFDTTQAKSGLYVSSVRVDGKVFGSIDMFPTAQEAEYMAAKNACDALAVDRDASPIAASSNMSVSDTALRDWIRETLDPLPNGMWGTRIPILFKEKFLEEAPAHLLARISAWSDLVEVEKVCGRDLVKLVRAKPTVKWKDFTIPEPELLDPSETVTIYVTFALRVDSFFVQKEDSCIDDINAKLEKECPKQAVPDSSVLKKGTFCAALYNEDQRWYRAEVLDITDESVQVKFLDYGNTETVPVSSIRQLPDTTANFPAQAIPCALYSIIVTDTESPDEPSPSLKEFSEVVKDSPISALTVAYNTDGQCEVELTKEELSINDYLIKKGLVRGEVVDWGAEPNDTDSIIGEPDTVILPDDKFLDVYVCFISPDLAVTVRIVGEEYSDKLDVFEAQLEDCFKKAAPDTFIGPGAVCIASMDGLYQRVLINSVTDGKAECYFTDHGDTENILLSQLRSLPLDLNASLPYQAVRCYLNGLEKVTDTVTALESLLDMALGKTCVAEIVDRDERLSVILYDTNDDNDLNINNAVSKAILAKDPQNGNLTAAASLSQPPSTHSNSVSPKSDSTSPRAITNMAAFRDTNTIQPNRDTSFNRTLSTTSADSWGTEEEAEALAASYVDSHTSSNWESSDIASPDDLVPTTQGKAVDTAVVQRLGGLTLGNNTQTSNGSPSAVLNSELSRSTNGTLKSDPTLPSSREGLNKGFVRRKLSQPELVDIPGIGEFFDVHVLWVSDPTNFWCTPYKMVLCLENMMKDLNKHFNTNTKRVVLEEKDLTKGMLMAGNMDGAWYRVIIKNIIEHQMSVYFPDYGQYNILSLEDLQPLPEQFYALPLCAVKAKLHDISQDSRSAHKGIDFVKVNKHWSEAAKYKFMELAQGRDFVCLVCDKNRSSGMVSVKLVDTSDQEDVLIDEVLIDMNFARSLDS